MVKGRQLLLGREGVVERGLAENTCSEALSIVLASQQGGTGGCVLFSTQLAWVELRGQRREGKNWARRQLHAACAVLGAGGPHCLRERKCGNTGGALGKVNAGRSRERAVVFFSAESCCPHTCTASGGGALTSSPKEPGKEEKCSRKKSERFYRNIHLSSWAWG